jgi:hypothetical protein
MKLCSAGVSVLEESRKCNVSVQMTISLPEADELKVAWVTDNHSCISGLDTTVVQAPSSFVV